MQFRYARHTHDLAKITAFYTQVIELQLLGQFTNHAAYDGVFIGHPESDWHLEFTSSLDKPRSLPDPDDLLVFYYATPEEIKKIQSHASLLGYKAQHSKNPYWLKNGIEIKDPDGFGVILTLQK